MELAVDLPQHLVSRLPPKIRLLHGLGEVEAQTVEMQLLHLGHGVVHEELAHLRLVVRWHQAPGGVLL